MKASRLVICSVFIVTFFNFTSGGLIEKPAWPSSILDLPDQGLYYGFVVNNSSHFVEIRIISTKDKRQVYSQVLPPPSNPSNKRYFRYLRYQKENNDTYHLPHVIPLWLELGYYTVSIRYRDDLIEEGEFGKWVSSVVVLDMEYVEKYPGPFTFEIEDDQ